MLNYYMILRRILEVVLCVAVYVRYGAGLELFFVLWGISLLWRKS